MQSIAPNKATSKHRSSLTHWIFHNFRPNRETATAEADKNNAFSADNSKSRARGTQSRQKTGEMTLFCLLDSSNPARAALKVEQNPPKSEKCSTADSKFSSRSLESRTKSFKIGKMFYSVTFAKAVWSQITGKSQKSTF